MKKLIFVLFLLIANICLSLGLTPAEKAQLKEVNFLTTNPSFENGKAGWTASLSGSFTITGNSGSVAGGLYSAVYAPSTAGNFLESSLATMPNSVTSTYSYVSFDSYGCGSSISARLYDQSGASLSASMTLPAYGGWRKRRLRFANGTATGVKLRLTTNNTYSSGGTCLIDNVFFGKYEQDTYGAIVSFSGGTPSVASETGSWISSINDLGTGNVQIMFNSFLFNKAPICVCTPVTAGGNTSSCSNDGLSKDYFVAYLVRDAGSPSVYDLNFLIMCYGGY
jgi:hypothetical protein